MVGVTSAVLAANGSSGLWVAREQMALSLGWHIVLACFGIAFPAMIWVVHRRAIKTGDQVALTLAKRWSKVAAVLFAVGAVSGTVLSFEMGILWPGLMGPFGDVLGLPFALEGIAFFVEAIFIGIYLYGWDRLAPRTHLRTLVPVALAGVVGGYCVITVNSWMNAPSGFTMGSDGKVIDVNPLGVLFTRTAALHFLHMWVGAFMLVGFVVSAVYATGMLRGRRDAHHRMGLLVPFAFASIAAMTQPFIGHITGAQLATTQPSKLAAIELATDPESRAPLRVGGVLRDGKVVGAISIPWLGSLSATNSLNGTVPGLNQFPENERPNANVVHLSFQAMVGLGSALALFSAGFWVLRRQRNLLESPWFLRAVVVAGPAAVAALEAGWITTEVGRQPWIVYRVLRVDQAVSRSTGLWVSLVGVVVLYTAMTIVGTVVLRSMARRWREDSGTSLPAPYGPSEPDLASASQQR